MWLTMKMKVRKDEDAEKCTSPGGHEVGYPWRHRKGREQPELTERRESSPNLGVFHNVSMKKAEPTEKTEQSSDRSEEGNPDPALSHVTLRKKTKKEPMALGVSKCVLPKSRTGSGGCGSQMAEAEERGEDVEMAQEGCW